MKEQRITIQIGPDGKLTADAEGFSGDACIKELDKLLEGLAVIPLRVDRKPGAMGAGIVAPRQSKMQDLRGDRP